MDGNRGGPFRMCLSKVNTSRMKKELSEFLSKETSRKAKKNEQPF